MPVNMIDFATMAPRSQEASQVQNNAMRHNENALEQTGIQFNQGVIHDSKQAVKTGKDEWPEYQYGEGHGRGGHQSGGNRQPKQEKKEEAPMTPRSTSFFDVTI